MNSSQKILKAIQEKNSLVCVGLDPEVEKFTKNQSIFAFNKKIIQETEKYTAAYKPNIAFYEAYGLNGLEELKKTIEFLQKEYPNTPLILDAKRADIPNTAKMYAKSAFGYWMADAVTAYPHLGSDSIEPFLSYSEKLTILLIKTSNPDSDEFQNLETKSGPYFLAMARKISGWKESNFGIFAGATYPQELRKLRNIFPNRIFLSAGVGAQGAENKEAVQAGIDANGGGILFNSSRSIIYAEDPGTSAKKLRDEINSYR